MHEHKVSVFHCKGCDQWFCDTDALGNRICILSNNTEMHKCGMCNQVFEEWKEFDVYMCAHHVDKTHPCKVSDESEESVKAN